MDVDAIEKPNGYPALSAMSESGSVAFERTESENVSCWPEEISETDVADTETGDEVMVKVNSSVFTNTAVEFVVRYSSLTGSVTVVFSAPKIVARTVRAIAFPDGISPRSSS